MPNLPFQRLDRKLCDYCPYFCEENVWRLCQHPQLQDSDLWIVFISNPTLSCALWKQRAQTEEHLPVLWDYHVVLLEKKETTTLVWDLDTTLPFPTILSDYLRQTFPYAKQIEPWFQPFFRVIEKELFLESFSSDRSHMQDSHGNWLQPEPKWKAPLLEGLSSNLFDFVQMERPFLGKVYSYEVLPEAFR